MAPLCHGIGWAPWPPTSSADFPQSWPTSRSLFHPLAAVPLSVHVPGPSCRCSPPSVLRAYTCARLYVQGYFECDDAVKVGRPSSIEDVQALVRVTTSDGNGGCSSSHASLLGLTHKQLPSASLTRTAMHHPERVAQESPDPWPAPCTLAGHRLPTCQGQRCGPLVVAAAVLRRQHQRLHQHRERDWRPLPGASWNMAWHHVDDIALLLAAPSLRCSCRPALLCPPKAAGHRLVLGLPAPRFPAPCCASAPVFYCPAGHDRAEVHPGLHVRASGTQAVDSAGSARVPHPGVPPSRCPWVLIKAAEAPEASCLVRTIAPAGCESTQEAHREQALWCCPIPSTGPLLLSLRASCSKT